MKISLISYFSPVFLHSIISVPLSGHRTCLDLLRPGVSQVQNPKETGLFCFVPKHAECMKVMTGNQLLDLFQWFHLQLPTPGLHFERRLHVVATSRKPKSDDILLKLKVAYGEQATVYSE